MSVIVFLSAVSSEFHHRDPERPQQFQPYREVLAKALRRMGPDYAVVVQEDLAQGFGDLLETLDVEVSQSSVVVHLVGNKAGIVPEAASLRRLHARHPDLLANEPELSATLLDAVDVSFTQWEVYLAFHHGGRRLVYIAEADAPRSPVAKDMSMEPSQAKHLERLKATGEHRETFAGQDELAWKVISSVARYGLGPEEPGQRATPAAIEAAREDAQGLTNAIAQRIRQPEVRYVAEADEIGVERFLRAVDTAALERELDRRSALEIVHDYRGTLRDAVEAKPTDADLKDLAFAELALGHYADAMRVARRCAELAEQQIDTDAARADKHRETALNAYFLFHDAAVAARQRDEAMAALQRGCELIDREKDPILWADYHQQLAEYFLDQAQFDRAADLIDEITDIREELQPATESLARSLLLWCGLLLYQAKYQGAIDVAKRAEEIFAAQIPPMATGIAAALNQRAAALQATNRLAEAEPLMRRAVEICEASLGPEHPNTQTAAENYRSLRATMEKGDD